MWDFHSLFVMVQMCFSFMLTDKDSDMRMCKHCKKAFVASRKGNEFCSQKCKNQFNVYKSWEKKSKNTSDFPDEYASSESRIALKGAVAKAKANAAQAVPELIKIAAALLLMLFIFWIQHSQSSDFNCSVTPSFFAICPASLSIISLHSSSISARCFHNVSDRIIYE